MNKTLEDQIGNLGMEDSIKDEVIIEEKPINLGTARKFENKKTLDYEAPVRKGYVIVDREEMGARAQFYPEDWKFFIKPAKVHDIKNWAAIDDTKLDQINTALNEILKSCLTIQSNDGALPWNKVNGWDRFWFLMKIREYTFETGENSIEFDADCIYCDNQIHYKLTSDALVFDSPDEEVIDSHWNPTNRTWEINPKDYDIESNKITLYSPTIEKEDAIINWAIAKNQENKTIDQAFLQFLPWLLNRVSKDMRVMDRLVTDAESIYQKWSVEMYNFMVDVLENIVIKPSEQLNAVCTKCGETVESNIRFPDGRGLKSLFNIQGRHKKFGSKSSSHL